MALAALDAALLAWLALEGPTTRARLAQLLWPAMDGEAARNSLRQRLFQLKKRLGVEIVVGSTTLALAEGVSHDLEDADTVLGQAAGEDIAAGEFAQWLELQRARRRGRVRQSLAELAAMAEEAKDWDDALTHARELLALEPLSEEAHRRLMRLHYLRGDRAAALLAFDRCEQVLKDEVGARPSAETLALLHTLDEAARTSVQARALPTQRVPAAVLRPPRLIAREVQWQTMSQAWATGACVIVLTGEAGMGKTRLATDFAQAQGPVVVSGARPGDARVVYATLSRVLRAVPRKALAALPEPLHRELARLLPELGESHPIADDEQRTRFFNAVAAVLHSPALALEGIVVDDLHFADDASVELLQYAAGGSALRWLVAARRAELTVSGVALLDGFAAQGRATHVELAPLTLEQVRQLLDSLDLAGLDAAALGPELWRHTGGNPLYLLESLKAWLTQRTAAAPAAAAPPAHWPVAPNVTTLIERRIGRLSADAVQLARCAAVAAPDFSIELAAHVLGRRTLELVDPWAELEAAHVLRDGAFAHDLIYESALASVPQPVARRLHAEIAGFLADHEGEPARLAQHWAKAGQWARAGQAFLAAAQRSREASRQQEHCALLAEAAASFERAGRLTERFDALLQRARALAAFDLGAEADTAIDMLDELAGSALQSLLALEVRLTLAMSRFDSDAALRLSLDAIVAARAIGQADLELRFAITASGALCDARRADEAVALLEPYAGPAGAHTDLELQWSYQEASALALDYAGRLADALQVWPCALAMAQRAGQRNMLWQTMANAASTRAKMGLVAEAAQAADQAHRLAQEGGQVQSMRVLQTQVTLAHRLRDLGHYARALALLEQAQAGFEAGNGTASDKMLTEQRLFVLYQHLGQIARLGALVARDSAHGPPGLVMIRLAQRAEYEALMGRDGITPMREALSIISNSDDIYYRITTLFASRLVPADEGESLAASLALWASTRERHGVALAGHVRAAACALAQGAGARALPHVDASLQLAKRYIPDSFYLPELWLVAAQVFRALGRELDVQRAATDGHAWVRRVHDAHVPEPFRDSFLNRNPVNRELLALAARLAQ